MLPTIPTTLRLAGLFALSYGLLACGQQSVSTTISTAQPTTVSSDKPSSTASSQSQQAAIDRPATTAPSKSERLSTGNSAEEIYTEFERLKQKVCQKQQKVVGNKSYTLCTFTDPQGIMRTVSASSSLTKEGDGAGYWLNENGDIYAIQFFHSGEVVVLLPEDKKQVVELLGNQKINVITNQARWNQLELSARDQIITISEQFDSEGNTPKTSDHSAHPEVEQVALRSLNPGALAGTEVPKAIIQKTAIVNDTALLSWQRGEAGGMMLLRQERDMWIVLTSGGGAMNLMTLSEYNVPRTTGQALLEQHNLNAK